MLWAAVDHGEAAWTVGAVVVAVWALSSVLVARRLPSLGATLAGVSLVMGLALVLTSRAAADSDYDRARTLVVMLLVAAALHLALVLPLGRFVDRRRAVAAVVGYAVCLGVGLAMGDDLELLPILLVIAAAAGVGLMSFLRRCRGAGARDRARLQWMGWGVVVAVTSSGIVLLTHWLMDIPRSPGVVALALTAVVPLGVRGGVDRPALLRVVDRVLVQTTVVVGLVVLVGGHLPPGGGRPGPDARRGRAHDPRSCRWWRPRWPRCWPSRPDDGSRRWPTSVSTASALAPDEALRTFAGRMSRAVPMDELLLQLVETLRKTMQLTFGRDLDRRRRSARADRLGSRPAGRPG